MPSVSLGGNLPPPVVPLRPSLGELTPSQQHADERARNERQAQEAAAEDGQPGGEDYVRFGNFYFSRMEAAERSRRSRSLARVPPTERRAPEHTSPETRARATTPRPAARAPGGY
jgi:hypothetical protein